MRIYKSALETLRYDSSEYALELNWRVRPHAWQQPSPVWRDSARLRPALTEVHDALEQLTGLRAKPAGRVRLLVPRLAGTTVLGRKLAKFARDYRFYQYRLQPGPGTQVVAGARPKPKDAPFANPAKGCGTRNFKGQNPLPERVRHPPRSAFAVRSS
jgi:hypothetical protein